MIYIFLFDRSPVSLSDSRGSCEHTVVRGFVTDRGLRLTYARCGGYRLHTTPRFGPPFVGHISATPARMQSTNSFGVMAVGHGTTAEVALRQQHL